jgi:hypothetical protein
MVSSTDVPVTIQTCAQSVPSTPAWFGEVTLIAQYLKHRGVLAVLADTVRFARSRFGHYDTLDFVVVLLGYAISGERTIEAFYERVQPEALEFMALFGRTRLPHRSSALAVSSKPLSQRRSRHCEISFRKRSFLGL